MNKRSVFFWTFFIIVLMFGTYYPLTLNCVKTSAIAFRNEYDINHPHCESLLVVGYGDANLIKQERVLAAAGYKLVQIFDPVFNNPKDMKFALMSICK